MRALQVLKNCLFLVLLFGMDQLVSIPQLVAAYTQNHHLFLFFLIIVYIAIVIAVIVFFWQFYRYKIKKIIVFMGIYHQKGCELKQCC
ncbi:hypothetical protein ACKE5D_06855 [Pediococcus pentosaceus]|uniref:hypothetical protein n=1 Tax=Pediococcus pentosaceus TaxID=1255 RepID=UPI00398A7A3A